MVIRTKTDTKDFAWGFGNIIIIELDECNSWLPYPPRLTTDHYHLPFSISYHTADIAKIFEININQCHTYQLSLTEVGWRDSFAIKLHDVGSCRCSSTTFGNVHPQFGLPRKLATTKYVLGNKQAMATVWQSDHARTLKNVSYHETCHTRSVGCFDTSPV